MEAKNAKMKYIKYIKKTWKKEKKNWMKKKIIYNNNLKKFQNKKMEKKTM
jgi:hypothetical protein